MMREMGITDAAARSFATGSGAADRDIATIVQLSQAVPLLFDTVKKLRDEVEILKAGKKTPPPGTPPAAKLTKQELDQLRSLLNRMVDTY
jgi:hypothetical protein